VESKVTNGRRGGLLAGGAAGVAAYVVGYVLTFVLIRGEARRTFEDAAPTWKVVGWYYYNAHFVDLVSSRSVGPWGDSTVVSLIAESAGSTATFLYVVPPLVLVGAGAIAAQRVDAADIGTAATAGAATVLGYGALAVLGALVLPHAVSGSFLGIAVSATFTIPLASTVVIAALLYPAVFGTVGAIAGGLLASTDGVGDRSST
jgi:hypothetical protein